MRFLRWLLFAAWLPLPGSGQQATGLPPFGSFNPGLFDTVNNANLNVQFAVPMISRPGRGLPFSYSLSYNSGVWFPVNSGGSIVWAPAQNWGWDSTLQAAVGFLSFDYAQSTCSNPPDGVESVWSNFNYYDRSGTTHPFPTIHVSFGTGSCADKGNTQTGVVV